MKPQWGVHVLYGAANSNIHVHVASTSVFVSGSSRSSKTDNIPAAVFEFLWSHVLSPGSQ